MTTETTACKGQEFFSPEQTERNTGGTLIGRTTVSLLLVLPLLTQTRQTMRYWSWECSHAAERCTKTRRAEDKHDPCLIISR